MVFLLELQCRFEPCSEDLLLLDSAWNTSGTENTRKHCMTVREKRKRERNASEAWKGRQRGRENGSSFLRKARSPLSLSPFHPRSLPENLARIFFWRENRAIEVSFLAGSVCCEMWNGEQGPSRFETTFLVLFVHDGDYHGLKEAVLSVPQTRLC